MGVATICVALVAVPVGSVLLAEHCAAQAVGRRDPQAAEGWLAYRERLLGTSSRGLLIKARLARHRGDFAEMDRLLTAAASSGASRADVQKEWTLAQVQSGKLEAFEPQIKSWLVNGSSDLPEIAEAYANGLAASSRFDEALRMIGAWAQDHPTDPMPAFRAGRIHEFFEDFDAAAVAYREALSREDDFSPARFALARVLLNQKKPQDAIVELNACRPPTNPLAVQVAHAECLAELGRTDQAIAELESVLEHNEREIEESYAALHAPQECFVAARLLGTLLTNNGSAEKGVVLLETALRSNPRDVAARYSRAIAFRGLGRMAEAEAELAAIEEHREAMKQVNALRNKINRDPEDVASRIDLGTLLAEHESVSSGLFWLRSALTHDPSNEVAKQRIAELLSERAAEPGAAPASSDNVEPANDDATSRADG